MALTFNDNFMPMKNPFLSILLIASISVFGGRAENIRTFNIREFGAKGDGKTLDTAAIQQALDACGKAGGGIVRLSPGTYLSQPVYLRDKTTLQLDLGRMKQSALLSTA